MSEAAPELLVDTSVIINSLRRVRTPASLRFDRMMQAGAPPAITPEVYREVLQGARDEAQFRALRAQLLRMPMLSAADVFNTQTGAAWIYAVLRWRGTTVRSPVDCLIARIAMENDLPLLHDDMDFVRIASIEPRLRLA